ncbi:hypothetical protein M153_13910001940 [Pseudoloma neurophilia]|uniref:Uncharacterized protein n=1 Tax=Pseudoloma neurophilia TaxID=146866 RepID=A0A0R0LUQ8_9MICR|nr:hypothetical protein M153_13910001940 [Pseudoloma neurophilia]
MQLFIQLEDQTRLHFLIVENGKFIRSHTILITQKEVSDFFIDQDNVVYSFADNTLFKVMDGVIPLFYDVKHISFGKQIYLISQNFIFRKITDSNFEKLQRVNDDIQGLIEYKNEILTWSKTHFFIAGSSIVINTQISIVKVDKDDLYFLSASGILFKFIAGVPHEIVHSNHSDITDMCLNEFLPVVALLNSKNVFIVDVSNKKIIKIIDSYGAQSIKFKNKREIYLFCPNKILEFHLGKDFCKEVLQSENSQFFYFNLKTDIKLETDNFKEEMRSKLIENKIENKRMIHKLMSEINELKTTIQKFKKNE